MIDYTSMIGERIRERISQFAETAKNGVNEHYRIRREENYRIQEQSRYGVDRFGITLDPEIRGFAFKAGLALILGTVAGLSGLAYDHYITSHEIPDLLLKNQFADKALADTLRYGGALTMLIAMRKLTNWQPSNNSSPQG